MVDYGILLGALSGLTSAAKNIKDLLPDKKKVSPEFISALAEMQSTTIEVYRYAMELVEENRKLKEGVRTLQEKMKITEDLTFENGAYWCRGCQNIDEGPYCHICWEKENKLVHLKPGEMDLGGWYCQSCENYF